MGINCEEVERIFDELVQMMAPEIENTILRVEKINYFQLFENTEFEERIVMRYSLCVVLSEITHSAL